MRLLPRWLHRFYAEMFGFFWLPCPNCGQEFGGHEWTLPQITCERVQPAICPACTRLQAVRDAVAHGHHFGYDIMRATGYRSGVMYPLLARLEHNGVLTTDLEPDPGTRPPRRRYWLAEETERTT